MWDSPKIPASPTTPGPASDTHTHTHRQTGSKFGRREMGEMNVIFGMR